MKNIWQLAVILALAHLAAPAAGQEASQIQLDGFAGNDRRLKSLQIIRENLQGTKWQPEPKEHDTFDPLLILPPTTLPEREAPPHSLPRVTLGEILPQLGPNDIFSQIIDGRQAPKLINALVPEPSRLLERLQEIGLSSTNRSAQCDQASSAIASDEELRSFLNELPLSGKIPERFAQRIAAFSSACFRKVFAPGDEAGPGFLPDLRSRAGLLRILRRRNEIQYCSAFLVDGRTAVTARHCFFNWQGERFPKENISFIRLASDAYEEVPVRISARFDPNPNETSRELTVADDFVTIDLGREFGSLSALSLNAAPDVFAFDAMFQVGFYNIFFLNGNPQDDLIERLRKAYVLDESKTCAAITYTDACIVQLCQSMPQTSGAALVGLRGGKLEILGTLFGWHNRSADCFPPNLPLNIAAQTNLSSRSR